MKKYLLLSITLLSLISSTYAVDQTKDQNYTLTINNIPANVTIVKKCGQSVTTQANDIQSSETKTSSSYSYSYSSEMSINSVTAGLNKKATAKDGNNCTLTIQSQDKCASKTECQKVIDFKTSEALKSTTGNT